MKTSNKNKRIIIYFLVEIVYTITMIGYFLWVRNDYATSTSFEAPLFNILLITLITIIWFVGPMLNRYLVMVYGGLYSLYFVSQQVYVRAFHQYYRFNTAIDLTHEVQGVKNSIIELLIKTDFYPFIILFIITIVFIALYFLLQRKCFKLIYRIPYKLASLLLIFVIISQYNNYNNEIKDLKSLADGFQSNVSDYYAYDQILNVNQFVEKFGLMAYGYRDAETVFEHEYYTIHDFQDVADFFEDRKPLKENAMTGIFKGKNLLMIQAESFNDFILDPELMPTLYKMKIEGINVKGFNTPALPGSTSDTEFMANTSFWPNSAGHAICYKYPNNNFPTTLPKMFKKEGYTVEAFHNCYGQYYNRTTTFPNFGYDNFYECTRLGLHDCASDKEVMDVMKWILVENTQPYMYYWISYSGHQPYNLDEVGVSEANVQRVKAKYPELDDNYVSYLAKNMEIDQCLGDLFNELKKVNKLDDLVVFFYGDHIVKGLKVGEGAPFYSQTHTKFDASKMNTDLFIYNSATNPMEFKKISTVLDFVPTIANLWDIKIDEKTIFGYDIFDEDYHGLHFSEWGFWYTDTYNYDLVYDKFYPLNDSFNEEEARKEINHYLKMKEISKKAMRLNYFKDYK